ncbi:hypothetical protein F5Y15DRAFT_409568 [Xylariaceae sp. FL0016]|nr:hypothetical protein F5Y15DRAFT_409568 [Xylariaceae sp. FL0016]
MDRPKSVSIAKWGAACSPCALAKAKCLRTNDGQGTKCDRCERLEKDCVNQVHKPRKKRQSKPSKTAQLEERLNSLVDLLKATNSGEVPSSVRHPSDIRSEASCIPSDGDSATAQRRPVSGDGSRSPSELSHEALRAVPGTYNEYAPEICICRAQVGEVPMPLEADDALLSTFVNELMPEYPFVAIPRGICAADLVATKPFLFATIRMISSYRNLRSMRAQNYLIMRHISEQMLMRSERSLEMLQSILLVLGYYHYHCMVHSQMSNLMALANSLAADLGINRPPELQERTRLLILNPEAPRARTNDERRALCGVWYMNSIGALAFQRMEPIKYTSYIGQCLRDLDAAKEYETDSLLVHLVRIQHLSERIAQLHNKDQVDDDLTGIGRAPVNAYFGAFQTELDKYRAALPSHLKSNKLILCHLNTATLRLWEPPIIDMTLLEKISTSFTSLSLNATSSLDIFYRSSAALKTWFEFWLSIEVADYFVLPMPACAQLINAVTMLSRWAKLSSPDTGYGQPTPAMTATSSATQSIQDPCSAGATPDSIPMFRSRDTDPAIPAVVSAIKAHFLSQPELQIDILGILQAMVVRFEQARREVSSRQGGMWDNNIWDLAARKISITRLKLERWAEIVASMGGESLLGRRYDSTATSMTGDSDLSEPPLDRQWPVPMVDGLEVEHCVPPNHEGWPSNVSWANDLFEGLGLDQNFFFDGPGDYGTVVLNSLGPSGN